MSLTGPPAVAAVTATLLATLLATVMVQPSAAAGAAPTCQGVAATVHGEGTATVIGTDGDDVIVATSVDLVAAHGGNDLICVSGTTVPYVLAGPGDDTVDATGAAGGTVTGLGDGDDRYVGSAAHDDVHAGEELGVDDGRDVIDTGPRNNGLEDRVHSGQRGRANPDEVRGAWVGVVWSGTPTPTSSIEGGGDSRLVLIEPADTDRLTIDNVAGTLTPRLRPALSVRGFSSFVVTSSRRLRRLDFRGSDRAESLSVVRIRRTTQLRVSLGGGRDRLEVTSYDDLLHRLNSYDGGPGRDRLDLTAGRGSRFDLDLGRGRLSSGPAQQAVTTKADGFEDARITSPQVVVVGTGGSNDLAVDACRASVRGLGGRDRIASVGRSGCDRPGMRFWGGPGADQLVGSPGRDVLLGGPGRDRVHGDRGRDVCEAEQQRSCEVRR